MDGQITITEYLSKQLENRKVDDLTAWINKQGKAQYGSVYILKMSMGYMNYLRKTGEE